MTQPHATVRQKSRLAIIAPSVEHLERNCAHLIQTALRRNNAVLCAAPGLPIGVAGEGPFQGASLTNASDRLDTEAAPGLPVRSETLKSAVHEWRPDTILACGLDALPLAQDAARQIRLDRIACLLFERPEISANGAIQRWSAKRRIRHALKQCFTVIVASPSQAQVCDAIGLSLPAAHLEVVPGPGIDLAKFARAELPGIGDGLRISIDGGWSPDESQAAIAAISTELLESGDKLTFIPAPPLRPSPSPSPSLDSAVTEPEGPVSERTTQGLRDAHFHVQLATRQLFPVPLLCAMAIGRPILAVDTPAHRRAVDERVNGVLISSNEPAAVAAGIKDLLSRPDLLASMAHASRSKAERRFDAAQMSGTVLDKLLMQ